MFINDDFNLVAEIIRFKPATTYNDFKKSVNEMKTLFTNDKICLTVFDILLSKPKDYIMNIIRTPKPSINDDIYNDVKNNLQIGSIAVYTNSNIIENNQLINGYYFYTNFENVKIFTTNEYDYVSCMLNYVNTVYENETEDLLFTDIISNAKKVIHSELTETTANNYILLSNDNIIEINDITFPNILLLANNNKLTNDVNYKENILNNYTPESMISIYKSYSLMKLSIGDCKFFTIYEDAEDVYLYSKNNNWLIKEKSDIDVCPVSLLVDLQLFELRNKMEEEYRQKYEQILSTKRNLNFKHTFSYLNVDNSILKNVQTKLFTLHDIIEPYAEKHRTKKKSYNALFPYVTATTCNNGVAEYVNYYMIDSDKEIITICLRKNAPGFASIHKGKFAISASVGVFVVKEGCKMNAYNIAFSITKEFKNKRLKNGITIEKLMKTKVKVLL